MKKKIKIYINKFGGYASTNILFLTFVVSSLFNSSLLRFLTVKNYFAVKPVMADLAFLLLIGSIVYFFKPRKQFRYLFIWSIILSLLCLIDKSYYFFYSSFSSISLLSTSKFVVDVGDAVVENVIRWIDFIFLLQPIIFFVVHRKLIKKEYYKRIDAIEIGKALRKKTFLAGLSVLVLFTVTLSSLEFARIYTQWNREFLVMHFGPYIYHMSDLYKTAESKFVSIFGYDKAYSQFEEYYKNRDVRNKKNKYTDIYKDKNLIVIHAESIQNFLIGLKFNGKLVAPNLTKMANSGMYFSNYYSQVSVGTSSDTEFTFNTSLMPASTGTVFVNYFQNEFVTIPKLLKEKGYYCFSMHGNTADFWNRRAMHEEMGYDRFYAKKDYEIDEVVGLGLSDISFFKQSVDKLVKINKENKNFYGTVITLSNHTPFSDLDVYGDFEVNKKITITNSSGENEEIVRDYMEGTKLGNYFKSVHYADKALGVFFEELEKKGLLENTVVALYGDHDARLPKEDYNVFYNYDFATGELKSEEDSDYIDVDYYKYEMDRRVPFIVWSKDKKHVQKVDKVMGMYNVLPTLGNMFGFESKYQLGVDIFNTNDNVVMFPDGDFVTDKIFYNSSEGEYLPLSDLPIDDDYINRKTKYVNNLLKVSDDIIKFNLIYHKNEKEKLEEKINK